MQGHRHHQPTSSVDEDEELEIEEDDDDDDDEDLTRDEFNLNKIILAVTRPGKVRIEMFWYTFYFQIKSVFYILCLERKAL